MWITSSDGPFDTDAIRDHLFRLPYGALDPLHDPNEGDEGILAMVFADNGESLKKMLRRPRRGRVPGDGDIIRVGPDSLFIIVVGTEPAASTLRFLTWLANHHRLEARDDMGSSVPVPAWPGEIPPIVPNVDDGLWPHRLAAHRAWLADPSQGQQLELRDLDLAELNLEGADLRKSRWTRVNLKEAELNGADFRGAEFTDVNLLRADLCSTDLRNVRATRVDMRLASLDRRVDTTSPVPSVPHVHRKTNLSNSVWSDSNMNDAMLNDAILSGSSWTNTSFFAADLDRVEAVGWRLRDCVLKEASLSASHLQDLMWQRVDARRSRWYGTHLRRAKLGAVLVHATRGDARTKFEQVTAHNLELDASEAGDGSQTITVEAWVEAMQQAPQAGSVEHASERPYTEPALEHAAYLNSEERHLAFATAELPVPEGQGRLSPQLFTTGLQLPRGVSRFAWAAEAECRLLADDATRGPCSDGILCFHDPGGDTYLEWERTANGLRWVVAFKYVKHRP